MSTLAPPIDSASAKYANLYRGKDGRKGFGEQLRRMATSGREVASGERRRWLENRAMFKGEQWLQVNPGSNTIRVMARDNQLRSGRRRDTVNRLRPFTEGRIALYATEKPPFRVIPPDTDQQSIDGAKQAEKVVNANWGTNGWNVKGKIPELARAGEIDGLAFLYVNWNRRKGPQGNLPLPFTADGQPITDRATLEMLQQVDPEQKSLWQWRQMPGPLGEVEWRVIRAGAISLDPAATSDFGEARWYIESRVLPRDEVERIAGRSLDKMLGDSMDVMGERRSANTGLPNVNVDDGEGQTQTLRAENAVIVHELFRIPGGDWPKGAHCQWVDRCEAEPLTAEPWEDELPIRPFMPKPDGGHIMKSRGTVDDLKPVQIKLNRTYSALGDWMDKMGNPPVIAPQGSIVGNSIYGSPGGLVEYKLGFEKPDWFRAPSEPAVTMQGYISQLENEMAEISNLTNVARGQSPGAGVESNAALMGLQQNTEQQLAGSVAQLIGVYEWGVSRALTIVGKFYKIPRLISATGVSDGEELANFQGEMLHGASRFKITGSITPTSRAAEVQGLMGFAQLFGPELKPYIPELIGGNLDEWKSSIEEQRQRQKRKNRAIAGLAADETAKAVYQNFEEDKQAYADLLNMAGQQAAQAPVPQPTQVPGMPLVEEAGAPMAMPAPPPANPIDVLKAQGIEPPRLSDSLSQAGVPVPRLEEQDDVFQQEPILRQWMVSEAFEKMPPLVTQVALDLLHDMQARIAGQVSAMAQQTPDQTGSEPAAKGTPSPPKAPGQAGGQPAAKLPSGG